MKQQVLIRPYQSEDLAELMSAWESANRLAHPFLSEAFVSKVRGDIPALYIPNAETWVAEIEGLVVGFISLLGNEVGAIFLLADFHGKGIGNALMNKAHALRGDLELEVFSENKIGRKFYKRYGFQTMVEKLDEPSGHKVIRLKYVSSSRRAKTE